MTEIELLELIHGQLATLIGMAERAGVYCLLAFGMGVFAATRVR